LAWLNSLNLKESESSTIKIEEEKKEKEAPSISEDTPVEISTDPEDIEESIEPEDNKKERAEQEKETVEFTPEFPIHSYSNFNFLGC
jgi:hypothetical protein